MEEGSQQGSKGPLSVQGWRAAGRESSLEAKNPVSTPTPTSTLPQGLEGIHNCSHLSSSPLQSSQNAVCAVLFLGERNEYTLVNFLGGHRQATNSPVC